MSFTKQNIKDAFNACSTRQKLMLLEREVQFRIEEEAFHRHTQARRDAMAKWDNKQIDDKLNAMFPKK